jgi:multiple sugar transport system permease protein
MTGAQTVRAVSRGVAHHAVLIMLTVMFLAPVLVMVLTSLTDNHQALTHDLWPRTLRFKTYVEAFRTAPLWHYFRNTVFVATVSTVGAVTSSVPVAYALSHLRWRGRQVALIAVLFAYMLPAQAMIVPLYILFAKLGWIGSFAPLIVPSFFGDVFTIFLLRQYFLTVPTDLTDLARVEGAGELRVLSRVVLPLTRPAIAAAALLHFTFCWNSFYSPMLYIGGDRDRWTLPLGLVYDYRGMHSVQWNQVMAASLLMVLPVVVAFLVAQRQILQDIALPGRDPTA